MKIYTSIENLEKWLSSFRNISISITALAIMIILIFHLHFELNKTLIIVESFDCPQSFEKKGISKSVLAKKVFDEINKIHNTMPQKVQAFEVPFLKVSFEAPIFFEVRLNESSNIIDNIELEPNSLSTKSLVNWLRRIMQSPTYKISGEFIEQNSQIVLSTRVNSGNVFVAKGTMSTVDSLIHNSIVRLYLDINPYELFSYFLANGEYTSSELRNILKHGFKSNNRKKSAWSFFGLGKLEFIEKEYKKALKSFSRALKFDKNISAVYHEMALCYYYLNEYDKADQYFAQALSKSNSDAKVLCSWATMLMNLNQKQKAIEKFETALESDRLYPNSYYNLGILFYELKRYKEAQENFEIYILMEQNFDKSQGAKKILKKLEIE